MYNVLFCRQLLLVLFLAAMSVSGCAERNGQHTRDGKEYGTTSSNFQGHWWDYYERGRSFSEGKFSRKALADFQQAVEGQDKDQWQARIDDIHFMDYFPHREMGVIYFQRGQFDLAISELENSIQSAPNAKAYYFLNKARGAKNRQEGTDKSAPELYLEGSSGKKVTNSFSYMIKGVAEDDTAIASIEVGDKRIPIELAEKKRVFRTEVSLKEGENVIPLTATDLMDRTTRINLEILGDWSGPLVEVLRVEGEGDHKFIRGIVSDEGGLQSLKINGEPWKITGISPAYNFKFALPKGKVTLVADDQAGNVTRATLSEGELKEDPPLNPRVARLEPYSYYFPDSMVVSDMHKPLFASSQGPPADTNPPFIKLDNNLDRDQETYEDYILLEGMVEDSSPIDSISINGVLIANKKGRKLFFSQLKKLSEGNNDFLVVAIDTHGNRAEKNISIKRKVRNIHRIDSRMSVAILPFFHKGETSAVDELLYNQLIDSFHEQKRFNIIEHKKVNAVLKQVNPGTPYFIDHAEITEIGREIGANTMLAVTVIESSDSVEIVGRLIDTETQTMLARNDIFGEDKSFSSLDNLLDVLAYKFTKDFPIFEGILIEVRDHEAVIDIGSDKQLKPNLHFICYRKGLDIKHPVTGEIIEAEPEILGEFTVKKVSEKSSIARLVKQNGKVRIYDRVIAR